VLSLVYGGYIAFQRNNPVSEIDGRPTTCGTWTTLLGLVVRANRHA